MTQLDLQLPRGTVTLHLAVAALAAVGLTAILPYSDGPGRPAFMVMLLTALLALTLMVRTRATMDQARKEGGRVAAADPTTGIATAVAGEQALEREFAAAQRGRTLSVALIRIEELGRYRAAHGKAVADQLLRDAGRIINRQRRGMHVAARYGSRPGTFLSILSGVDGDGAAVYGTRVRRQLTAIRRLPRPAAVNVGIAVFDMSLESPKDLLRRAEFALSKGAERGGKVIAVGNATAGERPATASER